MSRARELSKLLGTGGGSLLPAKSGNAGKYLQVKSDGSKAEWVDIFPSKTGKEGKTLQVAADGSINWAAVDSLPPQSGKNNMYLKTDGSDAEWEEVEQVTSEFHGFEIDINNHKLMWTHTDGHFSTANYVQWVEGQSDQIYAINNSTGNLEVTY